MGRIHRFIQDVCGSPLRIGWELLGRAVAASKRHDVGFAARVAATVGAQREIEQRHAF